MPTQRSFRTSRTTLELHGPLSPILLHPCKRRRHAYDLSVSVFGSTEAMPPSLARIGAHFQPLHAAPSGAVFESPAGVHSMADP
eukprot:1416456-Amphidinium_carterae.1